MFRQISCSVPREQIRGDLKAYLAIEMSLNNTNTWQITEVSNSRGDMQIKAETMQTYDLQKLATTRSYGSSLLEIPPYYRSLQTMKSPS